MSAFIRPRPVDAPVMRLIAFHHAAGSAAVYHPLARLLPDDWDFLVIDLPGRGKRNALEPLRSVPEIVDVAVRDVHPWLSGAPVALFGHSMGAVVATEVAHALLRIGAEPVWLGVSGRVAPSFHERTRRGLHTLSDAELLTEMMEMGGTPARAGEVPEFRERLLRIARADLEAVDSFTPDPQRSPLACPITVFGGVADSWAPLRFMPAWSKETTGEVRTRFFPGGHFYFLGRGFADLAQGVVSDVRDALRVPI